MTARITGIAIVGANGVIGDGQDQPFKIREDWARFKRLTMGHPLIVGRRTHDAIGRFLPGRTTIIVSRTPGAVDAPEGSHAVGSVEEALALGERLDDEVWVGGGGQIYAQAWPHLTHLEITHVHREADGDVHLPAIDPATWEETGHEDRDGFVFVSYRRRQEARGQGH